VAKIEAVSKTVDNLDLENEVRKVKNWNLEPSEHNSPQHRLSHRPSIQIESCEK
jgi:hypothetical protein